jgi:predicted Zn-dependent protease
VALAEGILRTALEHADDASETWRAAAQAQLVVAIAAQPGRHDEALQQVREIAGASPAQMLAVLEGLASVASRSPDRTRGEIARVQLAAADLLTASRVQLASGDALALDRLRAQALAAAGRADEALALYQRLVREQAGSGTIQEGYADLLLASSEPAHRKLALDQWRIVASRSPPRTPRWYKAKYSVALAQFQLGDATEAATLLRYLLETPPGLSGSGWEEAYRELLGRCER